MYTKSMLLKKTETAPPLPRSHTFDRGRQPSTALYDRWRLLRAVVSGHSENATLGFIIIIMHKFLYRRKVVTKRIRGSAAPTVNIDDKIGGWIHELVGSDPATPPVISTLLPYKSFSGFHLSSRQVSVWCVLCRKLSGRMLERRNVRR